MLKNVLIHVILHKINIMRDVLVFHWSVIQKCTCVYVMITFIRVTIVSFGLVCLCKKLK